jgi:Uma2 family endonuclease
MQSRHTKPLPATEESEDEMSIAPWAEVVPDAPYPMTQEEFEAWPDDGRIYELIAGRLVRQMSSTGRHHRIIQRVYRVLDAYAQHHRGWEANFDGWTFRALFPGESTERDMVPDSSLIRSERLPADDDMQAWDHVLRVVPDLVVEVASEGQTRKIMDVKVQQYLAVGVRLIWTIYPRSRQADIWQAGETEPTLLGYADWLDGRDVAPGLSVALRAILAGS